VRIGTLAVSLLPGVSIPVSTPLCSLVARVRSGRRRLRPKPEVPFSVAGRAIVSLSDEIGMPARPWLAKAAIKQRQPSCRWRSCARCTGNARKRPLSPSGWGRFSGCRRLEARRGPEVSTILFKTVHEQRSGLAGRQCPGAMLGIVLLTQRQDREQHQPGHAHGVPEPCG
jgi:hypothetical protein